MVVLVEAFSAPEDGAFRGGAAVIPGAGNSNFGAEAKSEASDLVVGAARKDKPGFELAGFGFRRGKAPNELEENSFASFRAKGGTASSTLGDAGETFWCGGGGVAAKLGAADTTGCTAVFRQAPSEKRGGDSVPRAVEKPRWQRLRS